MNREQLSELLANREFLSVATCDLAGNPNAAPKFFLKYDGEYLYLVDYTIGRTWRNLQINPRVSISFTDIRHLVCYQLNGTVEIVANGAEYEPLRREFLEKQVKITTRHIIKEMRGEEKQDDFEVDMPDTFVLFKVHIGEIVEIGVRGIKRNKVEPRAAGTRRKLR